MGVSPLWFLGHYFPNPSFRRGEVGILGLSTVVVSRKNMHHDVGLRASFTKRIGTMECWVYLIKPLGPFSE